MSTASMSARRRTSPPRRWDARQPSSTRPTVSGAGRRSSAGMRVVGCRCASRGQPDHAGARGGGWCQVGTIQRPAVISAGRELRLGPHPVLIGHGAITGSGGSRRRSPAPPAPPASSAWLPVREQRRMPWCAAPAADLPGGGRPGRLAGTGLLGVGLRVGVLDTDAQRIERLQRIGGFKAGSVPGAAGEASASIIFVMAQPLPDGGCWCRPGDELASTISSAVQRDVGLMPSTTVSSRRVRMRARPVTRVAMHDDLADHRSRSWAARSSWCNMGVHPHARAPGGATW